MEFLGFIAILVVGSIVIRALTDSLQDPYMVDALRELSPWLASNAELLSWLSMAILTFLLLLIPLKLKRREIETGTNGMELVGAGVWYWIQGAMLCLAIISVGYLAGIGWMVATY